MAISTLKTLSASLLVISLLGTQAYAESHEAKTDHSHSGTMNHGTMNQDQSTAKAATENGVLPTEPGQGAFATIAEIVALLNSDPNTDWSKVDISGLREHLIDMDEVTLRANSTTTMLNDKIIFTVTGEGRTKQAIKAMVPAHAGVLASTMKWDISGKATNSGAVMIIKSDSSHELQKLKALGFFGVMAIGAHHQAHHFAMAKGGTNVHGH